MRCLFALILVLASSSIQAPTALRIKIAAHSNMPGPRHTLETSDNTTTYYIQGPRRRSEWSRFAMLGPMVTIQRCDTHVLYTLSPKRREYMESSIPSLADLEKAREQAKQKSNDAPPNLVFEITTVDTGETKQAFGHTAHHYITTTKQTPSPELGQEPSQTVEDAWYLDMPDVMTCEPVSHRPRGFIGSTFSTRVGGLIGTGHTLPDIRPEFRYTGPEPQGLVLSSKRTTQSVHVLQTGEKQNAESVLSHEIIEISEVPIDPTLFEVPSDFKKVSQFTK